MKSLIKLVDLQNYVNSYKTTAAKKSALTRELKGLRERLADFEKAYKERQPGKIYGYFLGERIYYHDVMNAERNIKIVEKFKKDNL